MEIRETREIKLRKKKKRREFFILFFGLRK
jgi:hypothetical protein